MNICRLQCTRTKTAPPTIMRNSYSCRTRYVNANARYSHVRNSSEQRRILIKHLFIGLYNYSLSLCNVYGLPQRVPQVHISWTSIDCVKNFAEVSRQ